MYPIVKPLEMPDIGSGQQQLFAPRPSIRPDDLRCMLLAPLFLRLGFVNSQVTRRDLARASRLSDIPGTQVGMGWPIRTCFFAAMVMRTTRSQLKTYSSNAPCANIRPRKRKCAAPFDSTPHGRIASLFGPGEIRNAAIFGVNACMRATGSGFSYITDIHLAKVD